MSLEQTFSIVFMVAHHHFFKIFFGGVFYGASLTLFNLAWSKFVTSHQVGSHSKSPLDLNAHFKELVDNLFYFTIQKSIKVLCSTTYLIMFGNENSPFSYKDATLFGLINACLGCLPHDMWWVWICKTRKKR